MLVVWCGVIDILCGRNLRKLVISGCLWWGCLVFCPVGKVGFKFIFCHAGMWCSVMVCHKKGLISCVCINVCCGICLFFKRWSSAWLNFAKLKVALFSCKLIISQYYEGLNSQVGLAEGWFLSVLVGIFDRPVVAVAVLRTALSLISRSGRSQGLLYKHLRYWFIN